VVLAQAGRSSLGERPSCLGGSFLPERGSKQWTTQKSERTLAQAKLFRLDESVSRSGETSSPRRDLVQ